jgi:hypothetical protein
LDGVLVWNYTIGGFKRGGNGRNGYGSRLFWYL